MTTGLNAIVTRNMDKLADIASDAMAPLLQQYAMQSPPPNMDILVQLMAKKLEKDLMEQVQGKAEISDPMDTEIDRLSKMKRHLQLRSDIEEHQKNLANGGQQQQQQPGTSGADENGDGSPSSPSSSQAASAEQMTSLFGGPASQGRAMPGQGGGSPFGAAMPSTSQAPIR